MEEYFDEEWRDMFEFPNHQISSYGRVRNKRNGYILKPFADRYGYLRLSIGHTDNVYIHRLVCEYFYGPPIGNKNQVNHIDCNRQNNHVDNLEWCTGSHNIKWGVDHGNIDPLKGFRIASEINKKPTRIVELDMLFPSVKACAEYLGVTPTNVSECIVGKRKGQRIHGYHVEHV